MCASVRLRASLCTQKRTPNTQRGEQIYVHCADLSACAGADLACDREHAHGRAAVPVSSFLTLFRTCTMAGFVCPPPAECGEQQQCTSVLGRRLSTEMQKSIRLRGGLFTLAARVESMFVYYLCINFLSILETART